MRAFRIMVAAVSLLLCTRVAAQETTFTVNGVELSYQIRGNGKPVLLIPGWTQNLHTWDGQVDALAAEFRVIRFNRGSYGLSTDPVDALALLDHLGVREAIVIGHSVGAAAALRLALHARIGSAAW